MKEERKFCARSLGKGQKCRYAKVVEEEGKFLAINFKAKANEGIPDLTTIYDAKARIENKCCCVYCTHPSNSEEKFIGSVEPYFSCYAPSDCPELQNSTQTK